MSFLPVKNTNSLQILFVPLVLQDLTTLLSILFHFIFCFLYSWCSLWMTRMVPHIEVWRKSSLDYISSSSWTNSCVLMFRYKFKYTDSISIDLWIVQELVLSNRNRNWVYWLGPLMKHRFVFGRQVVYFGLRLHERVKRRSSSHDWHAVIRGNRDLWFVQ